MCHIVVKPTGIVRYLADHLTAEGTTSRFLYATSICDFSLPYRLRYDNSFSMKSCSKTSVFTLSFYEKDEVVGISVLSVRARKRHVAAAGIQHSSLAAFAALVVHCFVIARHAHCCILCPPNKDCSRNASFSPTTRSVPTAPASSAFVSAELSFFVGLKPFRPIRAIQGTGFRGRVIVVLGEMKSPR